MILHLVEDEKVINRTIENFEAVFPNHNLFLCFCNKAKNKEYKPIHVKYTKNVIFYNPKIENINDIDFSLYEKVLIHFLTKAKIIFCKKYLVHKPKMFYSIWGADIYNHILYSRGYELYSNENYYIRCNKSKSILKRVIKKLIRYDKVVVDFIKKDVDFFCCIKEDFQLLQKYIGLSKDAVRLDYFYYPIDQILGSELYDQSIRKDANIILCGNSRSPTNNHEYVLNILNQIQIEDLKIVMPLNYGANLEYSNIVIEKGKDLFKDKFEAITEFMPLNDYNKLMLSAKISVYGHWRGEAYGNIVISLYLGSKVYLSKHSPFFKGLSEMCLKVFELEKAAEKDFLEEISEKDKANNRKIMKDLYNTERLHSLIRIAFE